MNSDCSSNQKEDQIPIGRENRAAVDLQQQQ